MDLNSFKTCPQEAGQGWGTILCKEPKKRLLDQYAYVLYLLLIFSPFPSLMLLIYSEIF